MAEPYAFRFQAGVPYAQTIRVTGAKATWPTLDAFEVRAQVRSGRTETSPLKDDLARFITASFDDDDILLTVSLTGQDTRAFKDGYYDIFISDPDTVDARAIRVLHGEITVNPAITDAADE